LFNAIAMVLAALIGAAAPAAPKETPAARADIQSLQGAWKIVRAENNGVNVKEGLGYDEFIIDGTTTRVIYKGEERKGSFEIDPAKEPKWITFTAPMGPPAIPAIYELNGDHWKVLSRDASRPEGWNAPGCALFEYERAKKSATQSASEPAR
jgi:uncharacterized protein (TIGR03067 family)